MQPNYFFTSDTHFSHYNIMKYSHRDFNNQVEAMDEELLKQINLHVKENDVLWHLGDFSMYSHKDYNYYKKCQRYRDRINCRYVNIVWGNHDHTTIRDLFNEAHHLKELKLPSTPPIVLCHYAMAVWNKSHRGSIHLYGHSHSEAEPWLDQNMPNRRSLDVGVDNAFKILGSYRPWSLNEILNRFQNVNGFWFDHHRPQQEKQNLN